MFLRLHLNHLASRLPRVVSWTRMAGRGGGRRELAGLFVVAAALAGPSSNVRAGSDEATVSGDAPPARVSLWDRTMPGTGLTYADVTIDGKTPDAVEPVLLPLPALALAAGVGLGLAWVLRRRFGRR